MRSLPSADRPSITGATTRWDNAPNGLPSTYTLTDVATMFAVCKRTIKRRYQDGSFPKPLNGLGRVVRFDAAAIDHFRGQCNPR